ncbi:hypothetical protein DID88_001462 [Monilinia fructigena]|uniref:PAP-associated domain-containing protein n=1 Tax=Monilinia fructigena TaxID=38457 RepID=A0A395IXY5_9HELO|nr:hypothetical protein DID88_001462 [Monilinia fructigena]
MPGKKFDLPTQIPPRPLVHHQNSSLSQQSNSVPSTPHQHARNFSFESRGTFTECPGGHSPRSAYSESNITLPSRPPPTQRSGCPYETAQASIKRRMPYNLGGDLLEKLKDSDVKSKLSEDEERKLSTDNAPISGLGMIYRYMYSDRLVNLLCTDESDVDICITTDWKVMEGVCMIAELLAKNGMQKSQVILRYERQQYSCTREHRMIKTYIEIDPRVRPLAMIVKHWTKSRVINDSAFGGTLRRLARSSFGDDVDALKEFGQKNKSTLGELLFQFFRFYGHEYDYENQVVSVRSGKQISKQEKGWSIGTNNKLCVEEPFNVGRNLGNTADEFSVVGIHMEMRRAFDLISVGKLDECCEKFEFPKEEKSVWEKPPPSKKPYIDCQSSAA